MTNMKERISNVIAWVGFGSVIALVLSFLIFFFDSVRDQPELYAKAISCSELKRTDDGLLAGLYAEVDLNECGNYQSAAVWKYRGEHYGIITASPSYSESPYAIASELPGYTHGTGERILESVVPWALPLWLISAILNYILFGSARLLPWQKVVINEEAR